MMMVMMMMMLMMLLLLKIITYRGSFGAGWLTKLLTGSTAS